MATKTTAQSGLWSAGATWVGGVAPVDGDAVVVAAGHTLTFDVDLSAWVTGVLGVTINGAPNGSTPGKFTVSTSPGTYVLKLASGQSVAGQTNVYNQGQFHVGARETPYPYDCEFVVTHAGGTAMLLFYTWLDLQVFCTQPALEDRYARTTQQSNSGTNVIYVDRDLSSKMYWRVGDPVFIATRDSATLRYIYSTITNITATTITIADNLANNFPALGIVCAYRRNVRFQSAASMVYVDGGAYNNLTTGKTIYAEFRNTNASLSGTGLKVSQNTTECGGTFARLVVSGNLNTADVRDAVLCGPSIPSGGAGSFRDCIFAGMSSQSGIVGGGSTMINCKAIAGSSAAPGYNGTCYDCLFDYNVQVNWAPTDGRFYDCTFQNGMRDFERMPPTTLYRCKSTTALLMSYNYYAALSSDRLQHYDPRDSSGNIQYGRLIGVNGGGNTISHTDVPANPPVPLTFVHRSSFWNLVENPGAYRPSTQVFNSIDVPLEREPGQQITVTIYVKASALPSTFYEPPKFQIIDNNVPFGHPNEVLATVNLADNTDWQTLTLTYTVAEHKSPALRMRGEARVIVTNCPYIDWFYVVQPITAGGATIIQGIGHLGVGVF